MKNNIKAIRKKKNISQKELAKFLRVTQQAISYMENNDVEVPTKRKKKISEKLNEDVETIFPEVKLLKK